MNSFYCMVGLLGLSISAAAAASTITSHDLDCSEGDSDVALINRQQPYYPHSAMMHCLTGSVRLAFTIDAKGIPQDVTVAESDPPAVFDRAAIQAVEQWRFVPACRDGERAERSARQTIVFRLPAESAAECQSRTAALDESATKLLSEVAARHALLIETYSGNLEFERFEQLSALPVGEFEGDMARMAEFHRDALERLAAVTRNAHRHQADFRSVLTALQPASLADDSDLENLHAALDRFRDAWVERARSYRDTYAQISANMDRIERETDLASDQLAALTEPLLGSLEIPPKQVLATLLEPLDRTESLVELLENNRGAWQVENGEILFDDTTSQASWQRQMDELLSRQEEAGMEYQTWIRSFEDYSN